MRFPSPLCRGCSVQDCHRRAWVCQRLQETNGYYADALGLATVVLPTEWQERLLPLTDADGKLVAYCLEIYDTCVSKLMAGRDKDFAFILELLDRDFIKIEDLVERVKLIIDMPQKDALLPRLEKLEQALRAARGRYSLQSLQRLSARLRP